MRSPDPSVAAVCIAEEGSDPHRWVFENEHIIGNGSFGVVYHAAIKGTNPPRVRRLTSSGDEPNP